MNSFLLQFYVHIFYEQVYFLHWNMCLNDFIYSNNDSLKHILFEVQQLVFDNKYMYINLPRGLMMLEQRQNLVWNNVTT